ncbi:MAG: aminotransferase class V-fold PLP-dependent enzyme [Clostridia bacterium]|nr:aminotransferase class V-fold PLP-dependent enzyme [Clostridia bacterium]
MPALRDQFPICKTTVYLESAFYNGGCIAAKEAIDEYFELSFSGGLKGKSQWTQKAEDTRASASRLIGCTDPHSIAFTKNTVEGLNLIARSFPWRKGDNIIITDQEHTSNLMPWLALKDMGVECRIVKAESFALPVERFCEFADDRTRMIAVSHVQASTGYVCDLEALGSFCRERGIFLVVDAIQSLGLMPFKAEEWGIDAVSAGGHKGLLAVPGIGLLYVSPRLLPLLTPAYVGSSHAWSIDRENWKNVCTHPGDARKLEQSNLNYPGIYALNAGLRLIETYGINNISGHIGSLSQMLFDGLKNIGYDIVTPEDKAARHSIISVSVPDPDGMKAFMAEHNVAVSRMDAGFVRFSLGGCSSKEDVAAALRAAEIYYDLFVSHK